MLKTVTIETELTQSEIANLGRELAKAETAKVKALVEKKVAMDGFKGRLDGLASRISELTTSIETGKAPTEMEVEERPGAPGVVEYFRPGTNEKVGERPMAFNDRQQGLAFPDGDDFDDDDEPPAEEQELADTPSEAEMLRQARLDFEHKERVEALVAEMRPLVVVTPLDGGGYLAAIDVSGESLRDSGDTEDIARDRVLGIFAEAQGRIAPVTWGDVAEASAANVEEEPAPAPGLTPAPKVGLAVPKGKRPPKRLRVEKVAADGTSTTLSVEELEAEAGASSSGGEGAPASSVECEIGCDLEPPHEHSENWTAF